jgi:hypothetical protein
VVWNHRELSRKLWLKHKHLSPRPILLSQWFEVSTLILFKSPILGIKFRMNILDGPGCLAGLSFSLTSFHDSGAAWHTAAAWIWLGGPWAGHGAALFLRAWGLVQKRAATYLGCLLKKNRNRLPLPISKVA